MGWTCSRLGEMRNTYKSLVRKPDENRPSEIPSHRWEDNIKRDLKRNLLRCELGSSGSRVWWWFL
jgi:hypothetical protein